MHQKIRSGQFLIIKKISVLKQIQSQWSWFLGMLCLKLTFYWTQNNMNIHILLEIILFVFYSKSSGKKIVQNLFFKLRLNQERSRMKPNCRNQDIYTIYNKIHTQSSICNNVYGSINMSYLGTVDWGGRGWVANCVVYYTFK